MALQLCLPYSLLCFLSITVFRWKITEYSTLFFFATLWVLTKDLHSAALWQVVKTLKYSPEKKCISVPRGSKRISWLEAINRSDSGLSFQSSLRMVKIILMWVSFKKLEIECGADCFLLKVDKDFKNKNFPGWMDYCWKYGSSDTCFMVLRLKMIYLLIIDNLFYNLSIIDLRLFMYRLCWWCFSRRFFWSHCRRSGPITYWSWNPR